MYTLRIPNIYSIHTVSMHNRYKCVTLFAYKLQTFVCVHILHTVCRKLYAYNWAKTKLLYAYTSMCFVSIIVCIPIAYTFL